MRGTNRIVCIMQINARLQMIKLISGEERHAWLFLAEIVGIEIPDSGIFVFHESNRRTWDNNMGGAEGKGRI